MAFNSSTSSILNPLYSLIGVDLFGTAFNFFTNFEDPFNFDTNQVNPVGGYFFLRHLPNPFSKCIRGNDDRAAVGYGIGWAIIYALALFFGVSAILYCIWSPLGSFYTSIFVLIGFTGILSLTLTLAWSYNISCLQPTGGTTIILGEIFGKINSLPTLPEYAPTDILNTVDSIFNAPCGFFPKNYLLLNKPANLTNCSLCNPDGTVDKTLFFTECYNIPSLGLTSFFSLIKQEIYVLYPPFTKFLSQTCFVRGGCLNFNKGSNINNPNKSRIAKSTGILSFLILDQATIQMLDNPSASTNGQKLEACRESLIVSRALIWAPFFIILVYIIKIILTLIFVITKLLLAQTIAYLYLFKLMLCDRKRFINN